MTGTRRFERIGSEVVYEGRIASVRVDEFRYDDGETAKREIVEHPGAVAIVAHDEERLYLVRQPREPVGEQALLELPAGKLDTPGESPLDTARRELVEEVGKSASEWRELKRFYTSPGFAQEEVHLFLATGLADARVKLDDDHEEERIEVVAAPLGDLDTVIGQCVDAKSLVGLLLFRELMETGAVE